MTSLAPVPPRSAIRTVRPGGDWSDHPAAGWNEFRVRRALFLASLTLQAASGRLERPGDTDSPLRAGPPTG
jgi:hypothetical protein